MKIYRIIHITLLIAATSVATSALAGSQSNHGVKHLDCVQTHNVSVNKKGVIHLECVENNKDKKDDIHAYHERTDNPED